ncbi:MAG: beta-lactamase family protein [Anaerolineales bacterium]|nr:beta-lactamase family protein [Anaerolineales bacterium]
MTTKTAEQISSHFRKLVSSDAKIRSAYLLVHSDRNGFHLNLAEGETETGSGSIVQSHPEQPVYTASVGKLFTAVLVAMLFEQGKLSFEDRIADHLDADLMDGLHVFKGKDYSEQIQVKHLLNHTSGLHDFWEDKPAEGKGMLERLLEQPDRNWTPREIVTWSKGNLKSHFTPGEGFHYSDTGYHLLGLIIESAAGMPFQTALSQFIFEPLGMKHAFLLGYSQPEEDSSHPIAGVYIGDTNVINYQAMSVDYAGGGVTAPLEDLLIFMQALVQGQVLEARTIDLMDDCAKFSLGIDYGYGMMKIRTVPLIMPGKFNCWGNAGASGAFMFYHPGLDTTLIGCLNQFGYHTKGIRFMFRVIDILTKTLPDGQR